MLRHSGQPFRNCSFVAPREYTTEDIARRCWNDLFLFREIEVDCIKVNGRLQRGVISSWFATRSIQHSELFHHKGYHAFDSTFDKDFRDLVGLLNREGTKKTFTLKAEYRSFFEQLPSLLQQVSSGRCRLYSFLRAHSCVSNSGEAVNLKRECEISVGRKLYFDFLIFHN